MNFVHEREVDIERESFVDILKDLRDEAMILVRQQVELAKQETNEKINSLMFNAAYLFGGGLVLFSAFLFLLTSLTFLGYQGLVALGVSGAIASWVMPLITAVVVGVIGYILVQKAINTFKHTSVVPKKTIHSIKEDRQWLMNREK